MTSIFLVTGSIWFVVSTCSLIYAAFFVKKHVKSMAGQFFNLPQNENLLKMLAPIFPIFGQFDSASNASGGRLSSQIFDNEKLSQLFSNAKTTPDSPASATDDRSAENLCQILEEKIKSSEQILKNLDVNGVLSSLIPQTHKRRKFLKKVNNTKSDKDGEEDSSK
jgi:hypothetical protein